MSSSIAQRDVVWQWRTFDSLTPQELYAILRARAEVFVVEQNCPYQDLDDHDQVAEHLIGWCGTDVAAYLRLLPPGEKFSEASLGRVITTANFRTDGFGKEALRRAMLRLNELYPHVAVRISAQQYLEKFYASFGFRTVSAPYLEDNIPHIEMLAQK